jgi:hypothetical protein
MTASSARGFDGGTFRWQIEGHSRKRHYIVPFFSSLDFLFFSKTRKDSMDSTLQTDMLQVLIA